MNAGAARMDGGATSDHKEDGLMIFGLDLGNASMKLAGPELGDRLSIPHALALATGISRDTALLPREAEPVEHLHAEVISPALPASAQVFAGSLAAREYPRLLSEAGSGERKASSDRVLTLALVALGAGVARRDAVAGYARCDVVAALPLAEAMDAAARAALAERLRGQHQVRWLSTPGWAGRTVMLDVASVDVVPEAVAAYYALLSRQPELAHQNVAVIDIGLRSVDWAVFAAGKVQLGLSGGSLDGGLAGAADRILTAARTAHGPDVARHRQDVLDALREPERNGQVVLYALGRPYDLTDLASREMERLARDVARLARQAVTAVGKVQVVYLVGGGGVALADSLRRVCDVDFTVAPDPVWANAAGLWLRAAARGAAR